MSRHPWIVLLVMTLLGHATLVLAQEVSITSPASGSTVRGLVKIQGVKPDPESGWMSFKLEGPGQKDEFVAAVIKPYIWVWDTTARDQDKRLFPDGMYTIRAVAQSPAGAAIGETSIQVTVANNLGPGEAPSSVRLKVNYTRGHEYKYDVEGSRVVSLKEPNPFLQPLVDQFTGVLEALYVDTSLTTSSGGPALLRKRLVEGWTRWGREKPKNVSGVGKSFIQVLTAEGRVEVKRTGDPLLELGSLTLELPDRPLRVGDTWSSDLWLLLDPADDKRHHVRAQHKLDGFQWYSGIKTARIVSKFEAKDVDLLVPGQGSSWRVVTDYEGTRYSYFAYEAGRFVGIEDEINHEYEAYMAQATGGMSMSMGMSGMEAGMPGMEPGMPGMPGVPEVPGMMPGGPGGGMPGMMPGGGPGGGMPGMMPGGGPGGGMPGMMPGGPGGGMPGMMPGGPGGGMPGMMPGGGPGGGMPGMMPGGGPGGGMPGMMPGGGPGGGMPGMMPGGGPGGGMPGMMPGGAGGMGGGSTMPAKIEAKGTVTIKVTEVS